ncbi:MAG: Crotonobetainyl-CoA:carnitine CoA-transferase CaiB [Chloroflexi bacterium]|nr:MAG: Crotonobetainyl-CoA:carnitine CoA-transferase CaiB [Chloroflexota bacterium]
MPSQALSHLRICDFSGQLAGAGATRFLAAFGAQVIRVEDPTNEGRWDILRGSPPYVDERRGVEFGGQFQNHNVEKLGVTLNLRTERGRELLREIIAISDAVTENFSAGVMARLGFSYEDMRAIKPDIVYVSNCGFGHSGPYESFKTWGPIVQAISGLTFSSGLPDEASAGWGYSYMDHTGGYYMAIATMMALHHRNRSGEGQWVDLSTVEAATTLNGPALLDHAVNERPLRREGMPHSNRGWPGRMAPHGIFPAQGDDCWIAIACRDDTDWAALADEISEPWAATSNLATLAGRLADLDALEASIATWTRQHDATSLAASLQAANVPATRVQTPQQRIEQDPDTAAWGLWPTVQHGAMGAVRVDGMPLHLSETDWEIARGTPLLGQDNDLVFGELLGIEASERAQLHAEGVI